MKTSNNKKGVVLNFKDARDELRLPLLSDRRFIWYSDLFRTKNAIIIDENGNIYRRYQGGAVNSYSGLSGAVLVRMGRYIDEPVTASEIKKVAQHVAHLKHMKNCRDRQCHKK